MIEEENAHRLLDVEAQDCRALYPFFSDCAVGAELGGTWYHVISTTFLKLSRDPDPHPLNDSEATIKNEDLLIHDASWRLSRRLVKHFLRRSVHRKQISSECR